jgi:hypothetical protein
MKLSSMQWWRGLLAVAVLLGQFAVKPPVVAASSWLEAAICHAPAGPGQRELPPGQADTHDHCLLCQMAVPLALTPSASVLPLPRAADAAVMIAEMAPIATLRAQVSFRQRAPPRIG